MTHRHPLLQQTLALDLSQFGGEETARLLVVVQPGVDQLCTVGRTLKSGTTVTFTTFTVADVSV